jgi:serine palmitoyltransferase
MPTSPMQSPVFGRKKSSTSSLSGRSAQAYLTALAEADAKSRKLNQHKVTTPASTPALSFSSSLTASTSDDSSYCSSSRRSHGHSRHRSSMNGGALVIQHGEVINDGSGLTIPLEPPTSEQVFSTVHAEFGHCSNPRYRYTSRHPSGTPLQHPKDEDPPYYVLLTTYISYLFLICLGHLRDFVGKRANPASYSHLMARDVSSCSLSIGLAGLTFGISYRPLGTCNHSVLCFRSKSSYAGLCRAQLGLRLLLHSPFETSS